MDCFAGLIVDDRAEQHLVEVRRGDRKLSAPAALRTPRVHDFDFRNLLARASLLDGDVAESNRVRVSGVWFRVRAGVEPTAPQVRVVPVEGQIDALPRAVRFEQVASDLRR